MEHSIIVVFRFWNIIMMAFRFWNIIMMADDGWPEIDLNDFPNNMISGLTFEEILAVCNGKHPAEEGNIPDEPTNSRQQDVQPTRTISNEPTCSNARAEMSGSSCVSDSRFAKPLTDDESTSLKSVSIPKSTKRRNTWALNVFEEWCQYRHSKTDESNKMREILRKPITCFSIEELNYWLSKFVHEVRKKDSTMYPQNSLVSIIAGIQGILHQNDIFHQFFKDQCFFPLRQALDTAMKISVQNNVGLHKKQAPVVMETEEETLWEKGELGSSSPQQLIQTLFYLNGIHFGIRGGSEHHNLTIDQFSLVTYEGSECLVYREKVNKTYQGGLKQRKLNPKEKSYFKNSDMSPEKCHIELFKLFKQLRPDALPFYLQCKKTYKEDTWFTTRPMGINTLQKMLKTMCQKAGLGINHTNHSLKASLATRLYHQNVDEQLIMQMTGHRSIDGVRSYKRTEQWQIRDACAIIDGKSGRVNKSNSSESSRTAPIFNFYNCDVRINSDKLNPDA